MPSIMEELFEILFGAGGRINRAKYWRSVFLLCIAGLLAAVILLTAAGIAAPLFVIAVVLLNSLGAVGARYHDGTTSRP
jgi:uncharacterized membrane protein YhaH (DUF805 family)